MKKQSASKRVLVMAMASVMGFSCLVGCNGAKKEQPATPIQSQQVTPDSNTTTGSKSTTGGKSADGSKNSKNNMKGGKSTNNSTTTKSKKTTESK